MNTTAGWKHFRTDAAALAIIAGLGIAAWFGHVRPVLRAHAESHALAAALSDDLARTREMERSLVALAAQVAAAQRQLQSDALVLESTDRLNQRLANLAELCAHNGLRVDSLESGAAEQFAQYSTVSIRLSGQGGYRNCAALLRELRRAMPDVAVVSMQMSAAGHTGGTTANFTFNLLWHTQPQAPAAKK